MNFVALGLGLAIVNGFCRVPKGFVARPLHGLPSVRYSVLTSLRHEVLDLKKLIQDRVTRAS